MNLNNFCEQAKALGVLGFTITKDDCEIALWSWRLAFTHPRTGERMEFTHEPPAEFPWTEVAK